MASNKDPFPSSLPSFGSPASPIVTNSQLTGPDGDSSPKYFESALPFSSPNLSLDSSTLPDFSSQLHTSTESNSSQSLTSTALHGLSFSQSPESSPRDSSSGSSVQHQRNSSSNSSHSGLLGRDVAMVDEDQVAAWRAADDMAEIHSNDIGTTSSSQSPTNTALHGVSFSQSPESSPQDSSSGSSVQHQRNSSFQSSHSRLLGRDVAMVDQDQVAAWSATENVLGIHSSNDVGTTNVPTTPEVNVGMDQMFDFESAASSPGPRLDSKLGLKTPRKDVKMPFRSSPGSPFPRARGSGHRRAPSPGLHEASGLPATYQNQETLPTPIPYPPPATSARDNSIGIPMEHHTRTSPWTFDNRAVSQHSSSAGSSGVLHPSISIPFSPPLEAQQPSKKPTLTIHPTTRKSRVETQIPVKLTLFPLPPGVTKLHIPVHTVARPRQVAKKPPIRSPDMLELNVELVCTSTMQDQAKKVQAMTRAACVPQHERNEDSRRLPSGVIPPYQADDPEKPSNGGCVLICDGCMKREMKRASRKKSRNAEEEALWLPHSGKRIIIFNSQEVKDWEDPLAIKVDPKKKDKCSKSLSEEVLAKANGPSMPPRPMHVSLPMRIGCYCRHQDEKIGFQVIFTIKDHEDRCIAQAMTNSIMITDDHKTQAAPASMVTQTTAQAETAQLPGAGVFPREPTGQFAPNPARDVFYNPEMNHLGHRLNPDSSQNTALYTNPLNLSHTTSTTLTPQNLSRPASPSPPSERHQKRRKGGGSGNLPSELIMTKLNTADAPRPSTSDLTSAGLSDGSSSAGPAISSLQYTSFRPAIDKSQTMLPGRYHTRPPTPASRDNNISTSEARSQSMEDLTNARQRFFSIDSARSNRVASLVASPTTNSSQSASNSSQPAINGFNANINGFYPTINGSQPAINSFEPTTHGYHRAMNGSQSAANGFQSSTNGFQPSTNSPQNYIFSYSQSQQPVDTSLQTLQREGVASGVPAATTSQRQPTIPTIHKLIASEGPKFGGIEITCLGSGFHPGLQVMFGNALAITTFWGQTCLVCLLPPASNAGPVAVHFAHDYPLNTSTPPQRQIYFTYIDDDEPEIIKHALTALVQKFIGRTEDPGEIVRRIKSGTLMKSESQNGYGMDNGKGVTGHAAAKHLQAADTDSGFHVPTEFEAWLLKCLDLIDLDDSIFPPQLNAKRLNGQTMLHLSASLGLYRFAAGLLARGADPDLRDNNGMSAMHMASLNNHYKIVRKLRLAGADPRLRSLIGYTPADMASTPEMCDFINNLERSPWPQSALATPISERSRPSSVTSVHSLWGDPSVILKRGFSDEPGMDLSSDDDDDLFIRSNVAIKPQPWARSRRNSSAKKRPLLDDRPSGCPAGNDRLLAAATAVSAWTDQIATQVQQLQQSVHRTLPNLPMPTLPPMPNLPDYQDYPMVKRISSLVPQRHPRSTPRSSKGGDYHWWELLRGTTAPPPYDELYPHDEQKTIDIGKCPALHATEEALVDKKCLAEFGRGANEDTSVLNTIKIDSQNLIPNQRAEIMAAHSMKVKRLRSDRNLFFFWIPLLVLVVVAMLKDRVPQLWRDVHDAITYLRDHDLWLWWRECDLSRVNDITRTVMNTITVGFF